MTSQHIALYPKIVPSAVVRELVFAMGIDYCTGAEPVV